jgi:hypothetical protein
MEKLRIQYVSMRCNSHIKSYFFSLRLPRDVARHIPLTYPYDPIKFDDFLIKNTLNDVAQAAATAMSDEDNTREERYACMLLFDVAIPKISGGKSMNPMRHGTGLSRGSTAIGTKSEESDLVAGVSPFCTRSVHEGSLPALHSVLALAALGNPETTTSIASEGNGAATAHSALGSTRIGLILAKGLPLRCISRHFQTMVERALQLNEDDDGTKLRQIFAGGMLGVYRHCDPKNRPGAITRCRITNMWFPHVFPNNNARMQEANDIIYEALFSTCWRFMISIMREYLVFMIDGDYTLRLQLNSMFDYAQFRSIVLTTNEKLRAYLEEHMRDLPHSTMSNPAIMRTVHTDTEIRTPAWEEAIKEILSEKQDQMLQILYRRDVSSDLDMFHSVRGTVPTNLWWTIDIPESITIGKSHIEHGVYQTVVRSDQVKYRDAVARTLEAVRQKERAAAVAKAKHRREAREKKAFIKRAQKEHRKRKAAKVAMDHFIDMEDGTENAIDEGIAAAELEAEAKDADADVDDVVAEMEELKIEEEKQREQETVELRDIIYRGKLGMDVAAKVAHSLSKSVPVERLPDSFGCEPFPEQVEASAALVPMLRITPRNILYEHSEILYQCMTRLNPSLKSDAVLEQFWDLMPDMGCPSDAILAYRNMCIVHRNRDFTRKQWIADLQTCVAKWPYTYAIIQNISMMWSKYKSVRRHTLPLHYWVNQARAIREQRNLPEDAPIPRFATTIWFCRVCSTVYSLAQDARSTNKQQYRWGYRNVLVGMFTKTAHCRRTNNNGHLYCQNTPLSKVSILGRQLMIGGKMYMLCPQQNCGLLMVVDNTLAYNDRGIACCNCTNIIHAQRQAEYDRQVCPLIQRLQQGRSEDKTPGDVVSRFSCHRCAKQIHHARNLFFYGWTTFLCHLHATSPTTAFVIDNISKKKLIDNSVTSVPEIPFLTDDPSIDIYELQPWEIWIRKFIVEYISIQRDRFRHVNAQNDKRALKGIKASNARRRNRRA